MSQFFESKLFNQQNGFRKGLSTQQCLLVLLEKWKRSVDKYEAFGALLPDLSKLFDCLHHELLSNHQYLCTQSTRTQSDP